MEKGNAVKNKFKFIAILVLVLAIIAGTIIAVYNIKFKKVQILAKVTDVDGKLTQQDVIINANKNDDGTYNIELPNVVNSFIVEDFYTEDDEEILFNEENSANILKEDTEEQTTENSEEITSQTVENTDNNTEDKGGYTNKKITITLTEEELENREINLKAKYDKKVINYDDLYNNFNTGETNINLEDLLNNNENLKEISEEDVKELQEYTTVTLYNKRFIYDDKIAVTAYIPQDTNLNIEEVNITDEEQELTGKKNVKQKIQISKVEEENETTLIKFNPVMLEELITVESIDKENNILFYGTEKKDENNYIETEKLTLPNTNNLELYISEKDTKNVEDSEKNTINDKSIEEVHIIETEAIGGDAVTFSPNGNTTWSKTATTTISFSDEALPYVLQVAVAPNGNVNMGIHFNYCWTASSTQPADSSFTNYSASLDNPDSSVTLTGNLNSGKYYLWIYYTSWGSSGSVNNYFRSANQFYVDKTTITATITESQGGPVNGYYGGINFNYSGTMDGRSNVILTLQPVVIIQVMIVQVVYGPRRSSHLL